MSCTHCSACAKLLERLHVLNSSLPRVMQRELTIVAIVVVFAGAEAFFVAMPDFTRKKNAKKQRAGRAGMEARWGTSSSTVAQVDKS